MMLVAPRVKSVPIEAIRMMIAEEKQELKNVFTY